MVITMLCGCGTFPVSTVGAEVVVLVGGGAGITSASAKKGRPVMMA